MDLRNKECFWLELVKASTRSYHVEKSGRDLNPRVDLKCLLKKKKIPAFRNAFQLFNNVRRNLRVPRKLKIIILLLHLHNGEQWLRFLLSGAFRFLLVIFFSSSLHLVGELFLNIVSLIIPWTMRCIRLCKMGFAYNFPCACFPSSSFLSRIHQHIKKETN